MRYNHIFEKVLRVKRKIIPAR